jgi:hypothetical protein
MFCTALPGGLSGEIPCYFPVIPCSEAAAVRKFRSSLCKIKEIFYTTQRKKEKFPVIGATTGNSDAVRCLCGL